LKGKFKTDRIQTRISLKGVIMKNLLRISIGLWIVFSAFNLFAFQVIDGQGNILMFTAERWGCPDCHDLIKINAKTGGVIWRVTPSAFFPDLLIDKKNDIILVGTEDFSSLAKYSGATGKLLWEIDPSSVFIMDVQLDKNGSPIVDGYLDDGRYLLKYDGTTGSRVWKTKVD